VGVLCSEFKTIFVFSFNKSLLSIVSKYLLLEWLKYSSYVWIIDFLFWVLLFWICFEINSKLINFVFLVVTVSIEGDYEFDLVFDGDESDSVNIIFDLFFYSKF